MIHIHNLDGCASVPLAHYLKAIGVLRLVTEQADCEARGWWERDRFRLATRLTKDELEKFFLNEYQPTPLVSPWNKGAGFFKDGDPALAAVEKTTSKRFEVFRSGIIASRELIEAISEADKTIRNIKDEAKKQPKNKADTLRDRSGFHEDYEKLKDDLGGLEAEAARMQSSDATDKELAKVANELHKKRALIQEADEYRELLDARDMAEREGVGGPQLKTIFSRIKKSENYKRRLNEANRKFKHLKDDRLIPDLQLKWRGPHREWLDAAMVLEEAGKPKYSSLLGTGGNDGNFDFTNNFMKRISEIFDLDSESGEPRPPAFAWLHAALWGVPVADSLAKQPVGQFLPGTAGGANNDNGPDSDSMANPLDFILTLEGSIAFTSNVSRKLESMASSRVASPFTTNSRAAAYASASMSDENSRGEQWMPLWQSPATYAELRQLLAEGRVQVGPKIAREPLDFARAVRHLGTARGISAFQRYGYIERNGQSNLAVPLGQFDVTEHNSEHLTCIDDLDLWLRRLRRECGKVGAAQFTVAEKCLAEALFTAVEHPDSSTNWQAVLLNLVQVEGVMARGSGFSVGPIPPLLPAWVSASYDGTPEFRLALAFALQLGGLDNEGMPDPIRRHWLPLDPKQRRFATTDARLDHRTDVVIHGRRAIDDAIALVERRLVESSQNERRRLPLKAAPYASASIADLAALLAGGVNIDQSLALARAFMALDRKAWAKHNPSINAPNISDWPDDAWLAIRLCMLPWAVKTRSGFELDIGVNPALIRRLAAGDAGSAVSLALRILGAAGVRCTVRTGFTDPDTARLWAAALAFPITKSTALRFLHRLDPSKE